MPKRLGHLLEQIATLSNVNIADDDARKGKHNYGIVKHDKHREQDNQKLVQSFLNLSYETSSYSTFTIHEPKERLIFKLPYYPDRIAHHAILNILEGVWYKIFINNTYACIKNRGIHKLAEDLKKCLRKYPEQTIYCLKLDVHKFYPSINHEILKDIIQRKIKDKKLLALLNNIIDSASGVPIGNYLSQFFGNLYLTYFDHWIKEVLRVRFYFRYCDDMVILSSNKDELHQLLNKIKTYLGANLKLELKPNYQIFPVEARGIDFLGYKFYHKYTLLRKSIKQRIIRLVNKYANKTISKDHFLKSMQSYYGWLTHCNSKHFASKIESITNIHLYIWEGKKVNISKFYDKKLKIIALVPHNKYYVMQFTYKGKSFQAKSNNKHLFKLLNSCTLPINCIIYERTSKKRGISKT